jgi:hypothetical protein
VDVDVDRSGIEVYAPEIVLSELDGTNGFQLTGAPADGNQFPGQPVSGAGDVNGDGFDDVVVGAPKFFTELPGGQGASYIVFGDAAGPGASLALSSLDGANGVRLQGNFLEYAGGSVAVGDVNGDGFADVFMGARGIGPYDLVTDNGGGYVILGDSTGVFDIVRVEGRAYADSGRSVSVGDFNGDGLSDLILSAAGEATIYGAPASYVIFGRNDPWPSVFQLVSDGGTAIRLVGAGSTVSSAGDVNGDGYDDVIVGDPGAGSGAGVSYVVFGGMPAPSSLAALDGTNGFRLNGVAANDRSGYSLAAAGDVNGDGYGDVIVGAPGPSTSTGAGRVGASYVVFGGSSGYLDGLHGSAGFNLDGLDGTNGFRLVGVHGRDYSGFSVAGAGDVNGDGIDDLIVGAPLVSAQNGAGYVVFGKTSGWGPNFFLADDTGKHSFRIVGSDTGEVSGTSVAAAGDVNGDGYADLIVSAPNWSTVGAAYVIYGRDFTGDVEVSGTTEADTLAGTAAAETFVAGQGNDTITGGGGADVFRGGAGDDRIVVPDATFFDVDGGTGTDTLAIVGPTLALNLATLANTKVTGIEVIDLVAGSGSNSLTLKLADVLNLSDGTNTLIIEGDSGDTVTVTDGFWSGPTPEGTYSVYTMGTAILKIDTDISEIVPM